MDDDFDYHTPSEDVRKLAAYYRKHGTVRMADLVKVLGSPNGSSSYWYDEFDKIEKDKRNERKP